jgi:hypothetical protein
VPHRLGHRCGDGRRLSALAHAQARHQLVAVARDRARVPASGLGRRSAALRGPLEGWLMASSGLGPLRRLRRRAALGRGCGRGGQRGAAAAEGGRHLNRLEGTGCARS